MPPTREQHDAHVAIKRRPWTDDYMTVRHADDYAPDIHGLTILDEYVEHSRKAGRDA